MGGELLYLSTGTKHRHFDTKYEVALVGGGLLYLSTGTKHRHFDTKYEVALGGRGTTVFVNRYQTQTF